MRRVIITISMTLLLSCAEDNQPPNCTIVYPQNFEEFEQGETIPISVEAYDPDGSVVVVRYSVDGWLIGTSSSSPHKYDWETKYEEIGIHSIKAVAEDFYGHFGEYSINIFIIEKLLSTVANFTVLKTTISEGESVNFTDLSENEPNSWNWDFGDGEVSNEQNPFQTYNSPGIYSVKLTVSNSAGTDIKFRSNYIEVIPTTQNAILYPVDDAYVSSGKPDNNYGNKQILYTGKID